MPINLKTQITRPYFLAALFLLLLNDFALKPQFHNLLTGKLSDVAGLFAFAFFGSLFFRRKQIIRWIYYGTALCFVFWKSEFSQIFINFLNHGPIQFGRVVDYTDLWALLILPISYYYRVSNPKKTYRFPTIFKYAIGLIACFAFIATSSLPTTVKLNLKSNKVYDLAYPKDSLVKKMQLFKKNDSVYFTSLNIDDRNSSVDVNLILNTEKPYLTQLKLDSIISFTNRDNSILSIFDTSKRDIKAMKSLTLKDYETLFEGCKIKLLEK